MNWVDYTMIGFLVLLVAYGFTRGFVRQILGIVGIVSGLILAAQFAGDLSGTSFFSSLRGESPKMARIAAYIAIFLLVSVASGVLVTVGSRWFPKKELGATDGFLGAVLGAIQGVLLLGGVSIGLLEWNDARAEPVRASVLAPKLADGCKALVLLIPEKGRDEIREGFEKGKEAVEDEEPRTGPRRAAPQGTRRSSVRTHADPPSGAVDLAPEAVAPTGNAPPSK